jgi:hypothetical protein
MAPIVGGQVDIQLDAMITMIDAARLLTEHHAVMTGLLSDLIDVRDGGDGTQRAADLARVIAAHEDDIRDVVAAFDEADRLLAQVTPDGLLGPVEAARSELVANIEKARPLVDLARAGVSVLPSIMGVGGKRRYLVLALDNAEIRPIGGLIGAFARVRLTDGLMADPVFRDIGQIDRPDQTEYVRPPAPLRDHLLGAGTWQMADAGWWPDFADSAREARHMYEIETGDGDFQGVIAFTPEFVDELLTVVGPVEIPEAGITVHPGETYLISLEQVEVLNQGKGRKRFLAQLASEVMQRLLSLPIERYPEVFAAIDRAGKRRQLQVLFDDPLDQAFIDQMGWYTPFSFPSVGDRLSIMESNVGPPSKMNVLVDMRHTLDVELQPDGSAQERLVTQYTNRFGKKLPPELKRVRSVLSGILGSYQRRYLVPDAEVLSVTSDDRRFPVSDPESMGPESGSLMVGNYQFIRPGKVNLETRYLAPDVVESASDPAREGTYRLTFHKQAGRDRDGLVVRVTVPEGTIPSAWSEGGRLDGQTVVFETTTEFDRIFEVSYAAAMR